MTDTSTHLDTIEALDFDPDVACESLTCHRDSAHSAAWWIQAHCVGVMPFCDRTVALRYEEIARGVAWMRCVRCGTKDPIAPYRVLGPVRSGGTS